MKNFIIIIVIVLAVWGSLSILNLKGLVCTVALMTFWDLTIHIIDKRDRKYRLGNEMEKTWFWKMKNSNSLLSRYYPFFWGKKVALDDKKGWERYDFFWLAYWGLATVLLVVYLIAG